MPSGDLRTIKLWILDKPSSIADRLPFMYALRMKGGKHMELKLHKGGIISTTPDVSMLAILSALHEPDLVWYSATHGDIGDNIALIAVANAELPPEFNEPHEQGGPIRKWVRATLPITEYRLNASIAKEYGIDYASHTDAEGEQYEEIEVTPECLPATVRYYIDIHDEYFTYTYPATKSVAHRFMAQALNANGLYFKQDFKWGTVAERLTDLLFQWKAIDLKSEWRRNSPVVYVSLPKRRWAQRIWPGLEYERVGYIGFATGQAAPHLQQDKITPPPVLTD